MACSGLSHIDGERRLRVGERGPVHVGRSAALRMRRDKGQPSRQSAQGQRQAEVRRTRTGCRDAGADGHRNARRPARLKLFIRPPEDGRIAALQPYDALACSRRFHDQRIDRALIPGMPPRPFADRHAFGFRPDQLQNTGADQRIVEDDVRTPKQPLRFQRQEIRVSGSAPDKPDCPWTELAIVFDLHDPSPPEVGPSDAFPHMKRIPSLQT